MTSRSRTLLSLMLLTGCATTLDPHAAYLGNTLIAIDRNGADDSHLWLDPNGRYTLFGGMPTAWSGRFTFTPTDHAGLQRLCLTPAAGVVVPAAFGLPPPTSTDRFRATPCVTLPAHQPDDRWPDPARPGASFLLLRGQR